MNAKKEQTEASVYLFDGFRVDALKRLVYGHDNEALPLKGKAFETLLFLVRNSGRVIERDELLSAIWPDTVVEENNLTQHISSLRRALGETPDDHRYIATIPGRGYKFVVEVSTSGELGHESPTTTEKQLPSRLPRIALPFFAVSGLLILILLAGSYYYWSGAQNADAPRSIAVLPFKPIVASSGDESLEMGMADTVISKLGNIDGIVVRPLASVRRFNTLDHDSVDAGRLLGVDAVLEGSVQIADDRVRVSARLLRVADSKQLWFGQFDENLTHIFAVQDSISERVASALQVRLGQPGRRQTNDPEAYQHYARGRFHSFKLTPAETEKGLTYYQKAIEIDPNYALAYAGMSDAFRSLVLSSEYPPKEYFERSVAAARKAIELDDQLAEGHISLALVSFWYTRDWTLAENEFRTGLRLDPNGVLGHLYYAHLLSNLGRHAEAVEEARKARAIDPVSPFISSLEGLFLLQAGHTEAALKEFDKASDVDPQFWMPHLFTSRAMIESGSYREAVASARRATELSPAQSISIAYESYAAAKLGEPERATTLLNDLLRRSREKYVPPYHLAIAYIGIGDRENALASLERGVAENDPKVVFLKVEGVWDEMRTEPRFRELIARMKFE